MAPRSRIGTKIRRARERKRMSQVDLAGALGVSRSAVNAWENDRAYPQNSIGALEDELGVRLDEPEPEPELPPSLIALVNETFDEEEWRQRAFRLLRRALAEGFAIPSPAGGSAQRRRASLLRRR